MSLSRRQALVSGAVWFVISGLFAAVFFSIGAEAFADPAHVRSRALVAAVILPGFILNLIAMERARRGRKRGDVDERDEGIALRASEVTLIILAILVYACSIGLYEVHRDSGVVPVGWLYFMAYGTMSLISLAHPLVILALDYGGRVDG